MFKNRKNLVSISLLGGKKKKTVKQIKNPDTVVRRCSVKTELLKIVNFANF